MTENSAHSPLRHPGRLMRETCTAASVSMALAQQLLRLRLAQLYRHSSLGLLWAVLPTLVIVSGVTLGLRGDEAGGVGPGGAVAFQVHVAFGVVLMQTFVETFNGHRGIFDLHMPLLQRMRFPVEAVMIAQVAESAFHLLAKIPVLLLVMVFFGVPLAPTLLLGLLACMPILLAGIALGALLAPLSTLGKDLDRAMVFLPWLVFLVTPVFYLTPTEGPWAAVQAVNPITAMLDGVRHLAYAGTAPAWLAYWITVVSVLLVLPLSLLMCKLAPPHLAERLPA